MKLEGLEQELAAMQVDMANVEEHNRTLKSQAVVVEAEARAIQIRFARISSELGVPVSHSRLKQLEGQAFEARAKTLFEQQS